MTLIGASSTIVAKQLLTATPPLTLITCRFICASLLLYLLRSKEIRTTLKESIKAGILIGTGFGFGCIFLYYGMQVSESGHAAFLIISEVAIVPIFNLLLFRVKPTKLENVGIVLALIGVCIFTKALTIHLVTTDIYLLISACAYAWYTIALSQYASHGSLFGRVFVAFLTVATLAGVGAVLTEPHMFPQYTTNYYLLFAYIVAVATVVRFIGQSWGQKVTSATRTTLIFTLEPLFTLALSAYFYGEHFQVHQAIGGVFILLAAVLGAFPHAKEREIIFP